MYVTMIEFLNVLPENKAVLGSSFLSLIGIGVAYLLRRTYSKSKGIPANGARNFPLINEVLFFSEKYALCDEHSTYGSPCNSDDCGLQKLKKIIAHLDSATTSLDICVFVISSDHLAEVILRKFEQGVRVRIITDESAAYDNGSKIPSFRKKSVPVRTRQSTQFLMHHKFAIVDESILINGSFNWTRMATFGNWENVHICNHPESVVKKYCEEFDELWNSLL